MSWPQKAKESGARQFIFLSSVSVYGLDEGILPLQTGDFTVCILRPPMVYGSGCKENYQMLVKIVWLSPVFPDYQKRRSMVSIETLYRSIRDLVDQKPAAAFSLRRSMISVSAKWCGRSRSE